jgi:hypothetical protein
LAKLLTFRKAGEPGEVAINPDRVTCVRAATGAFTDIYFGAERVAVEGPFAQIVARLNREDPGAEGPPGKDWLRSR